jgi:hypothetical protein
MGEISQANLKFVLVVACTLRMKNVFQVGVAATLITKILGNGG